MVWLGGGNTQAGIDLQKRSAIVTLLSSDLTYQPTREIPYQLDSRSTFPKPTREIFPPGIASGELVQDLLLSSNKCGLIVNSILHIKLKIKPTFTLRCSEPNLSLPVIIF